MLQTLLQSLAQRPMKAAAAIDRAITKALLITNPMLPLVVGRGGGAIVEGGANDTFDEGGKASGIRPGVSANVLVSFGGVLVSLAVVSNAPGRRPVSP